ncbi:MAG: diguanylate cyclase [Eubacterium sp.]|jgi:diguanylate cyclase (GGDEF)-like protein/PAS domain S-box-containing protein|nr:diguanylate cyclase [Eubacterium sp.]
MKIRSILILIIVIFFVSLTVIFSSFIASNTNIKADKQLKKYLTELADKQVSNIGVCFSAYTRAFKNIGMNYAVRDYIANHSASDEAAGVFEAYIGEDRSIKSLALIDGAGKVRINAGEDIITDGLVEKASELSESQFYCYADVNSETHYVLSKMLISEGFWLICIFNIDDLANFVEFSSFQDNGRVFLIDPAGTIIDLSIIGDLNDLNMPEYQTLKPLIEENQSEIEGQWTNYEIGQKQRIALIKSVADTGWYAVAVAEKEEANVYAENVGNDMGTLSFIIIISLLVLCVFAMFMFFKPLYYIDSTIRNIKSGDYDTRIAVKSKNEYGKIADEFNKLLNNIILSEARHKTIVEMSDNIIFEWNFKTKQVRFSNNFNKKFSYRAASDYYHDSFLVKCRVHPDDAQRYIKDLEKLAEGEVFKHNEYRIQNIYGDYIWILMRTATITDLSGDIVKVVGVIIDIDRAKKSEEMLTLQASFDALTEMFNRETVESLINNEIELLSVRKNQFSILFIDVDDFKYFNDNFSHATGDQVLKFTADTINDVVSGFGIAGRYGGDEFVACVRNSDINEPDKVAKTILDRLKEGFDCEGAGHLAVNVSIGIAVMRDSSQRVDDIIGQADEAMYRIKKSGKSAYGFIN